MRDIISKALVLAAFLALICSCDKNRYADDNYPETLNGLWMESFMDTITGKGDSYALVIDGSRAELNFISLDDKEGYYITKQVSGDVKYSRSKGTGEVSITDKGSEDYSFTFSLGTTGMMFTSDQNILTYLKKRTLDDFLNQNNNFLLSDRHDVELTGPATLERAIGPVPVPNLMDSFLAWLVPIIGRTAVTYGCNALFNEIFGSEESSQLNEIIYSVNQINNMLSELTELFHNTTYETYLNKRVNDYVSPLINFTAEYYSRLLNCDGSDEAVKEIVLEWGDKTVGGNPACVQYQNFIDFLTKSIVEQKNLYQIYDTYVFNTTPWEEAGYAFREGIRSSDLAVISENAILAAFYYRLKDGLDDETRESCLKKIDSYVNGYKAFADANPVERHNDLAICQIKGAHFIMNKSMVARNYFSKPWFPNGTEWDSENNESAWVLTYGEENRIAGEVYRRCLSEGEIKTLLEYYKSSGYTSLADLLRNEAGCIIPQDENGKTYIMLCQGEGYTERYEYDDYKIYASKAVLVNKSTTLGRQDIGIAYLEHYGFLWLSQRFARWTSEFDRNRIWIRADIDRY